MKICFSLGRCVRDIVRNDVGIDDVAFIIAATCITDKEHLNGVIKNYMFRGDDYLYGLDEEKCQEVALELWESNRILQPRREGMARHRQPENAVWVDMYPTVVSKNEAVNNAWNSYRIMIHMIENVETDALEIFKGTI